MPEKAFSKVASSSSVPVLCLLQRAKVNNFSKVWLDAECSNEEAACQVYDSYSEPNTWQVFLNCTPQPICVE